MTDRAGTTPPESFPSRVPGGAGTTPPESFPSRVPGGAGTTPPDAFPSRVAGGAGTTPPDAPFARGGKNALVGRTWHISRLIKPIALTVLFATLVALVLALQLWIPLLPRPVLRTMTEALLRTVLVVYGIVLLASFVGVPLFGLLTARSRRRGGRRLIILRGFLVCLSCLVSLMSLELGSAAWHAWMHRFPSMPAQFAAASPGEYRIVVLGGSSALGEPYRPWLSVGQIVAWRLGQAVTNRRFTCEILAWLGDSLELQHRKLADLKERPDMVIIYSGHNEFAARYEEEREASTGEEAGVWLLDGAFRASLGSPFCRLVYEVISKNRLDSPPLLARRHQLFDPPQCSPSERAEILEDFRSRLEAIVSYCEQIGALSVLIVPPANESGYEPSRSTLPPSVSPVERDRLARAFHLARDLETSGRAAGERAYESMIAQHPGFAEAHFRLGRLLEQQGRRSDAGRHYLAALENDGLPIRCPEPLRDAIENVARRHPRSIFVNGRAELAAASPTGLLGDHVIQDTHHPTLRGYVALASAVLRELSQRQTFSEAPISGLPLEPGECARHFGMDGGKWATVCERASEHYRRVAGYRYDPAERMEKSRRYAEAARQLRAGAELGAIGLSGVGVEDTPVADRDP